MVCNRPPFRPAAFSGCGQMTSMEKRRRKTHNESKQGQELEGVHLLLWYMFLLMIRGRLERKMKESKVRAG